MLGTVEERLREIDRLYPTWEKCTLWTRFQKSAERYGDREYIVFEDCSFTYGQVEEKADECAMALYGMGVRQGHHVAVILDNCPEFVFLTYAIAKLGAVKIPINTRVASQELEYLLNQSDADWLISQFVVNPALIEKCPLLKKVVVLGNNKLYESPETVFWPEFLKFCRGG